MHFNEIGVTDSSIHFFSSPSRSVRATYCHTLSTGHFYCNAPYFLHRMRYDSFLAILVVDGCLSLRRQTRDIPVLSGGLLLLDCYQEHCYYTQDHCEFYFFHFDGPGCRSLVDMCIANNGGILTPPLGMPFLSTFKTILDMHGCNVRPPETHIAMLLYQFLCELSHTQAQLVKSASDCGEVNAVLEYIHNNLAEPLSLEMLARIANYSQGHLNRMFHLRTGVSVYHYIMLCRIDKAKHLLHTSNESIQSIGRQVGFPSDANFVRVFSKYVGYSPSAFRKMGL